VWTIRTATLADARAIAEVHVEGWRWGFRDMLPDEIIDAQDVDRLEQQWIAGFTVDWHEGDVALLAADDTGRAIGFAAGGPAADERAEPPEGAGELYFIYVREAAKDRGIGWGLLQAIERVFREYGFRRAVLWVFEDNARARAFYERAGWVWDGTRGKHRFGCTNVPLARYAQEL
jgi:ribosomal protein S18 acetylase RimI-like enzyme